MKKIIKIPIYFGRLHIVQEETLNIIGQKYDIEASDCAAFAHKISKENKMTQYLMAFTYNCTPTMIAHEALHVVGMIYKDRGIEFNKYNDENQCYLLGWIVGKCFENLKINPKDVLL